MIPLQKAIVVYLSNSIGSFKVKGIEVNTHIITSTLYSTVGGNTVPCETESCYLSCFL